MGLDWRDFVSKPLPDRAPGGETSPANVSENQTPGQDDRHIVIVASPKNVGVAILLAIFFGPLGMLYATVSGAILMVIVFLFIVISPFVVRPIGPIYLGFGLLIFWPACIIWAGVATAIHNKRLLR